MFSLFQKSTTNNFVFNESDLWTSEFKEYVNSLNYEDLEKNHTLYKNTRNTVYKVRHPTTKEELILKRSKPSDNYTLDRMVSHYLRNFFKNYGKKSFIGAQILQKNNIPTLEPLAYWKIKVGFLKYESCFLCKLVDHSYSVRDFLEKTYIKDNPSHENIKKELINQMCTLIREIHGKGLLHGDLIVNNFLVKETEKAREMIVIDTDHVRHNILPSKLLKRFFAIRCLCRMNFSKEEQKKFLKTYLQNGYHDSWYYVLQFWRWWDRRPMRKIRYQIKKVIKLT